MSAITHTARARARSRRGVDSGPVRLVVARCQVDYAGRLTAHLPMATRVLMIKADGSVLVHSDGGSYKPLNWMSPPCTLAEGHDEDGTAEWVVTSTKTGDSLRILLEEVHSDSSHELGVDPGLVKDGVEKHLQELLAPVRGIFAAQAIKPQARVLATDRGISCAVVDYDALRGMDDAEARLF